MNIAVKERLSILREELLSIARRERIAQSRRSKLFVKSQSADHLALAAESIRSAINRAD